MGEGRNYEPIGQSERIWLSQLVREAQLSTPQRRHNFSRELIEAADGRLFSFAITLSRTVQIWNPEIILVVEKYTGVQVGSMVKFELQSGFKQKVRLRGAERSEEEWKPVEDYYQARWRPARFEDEGQPLFVAIPRMSLPAKTPVAIIDDIIDSGETTLALLNIASQSNAAVVGIGALIGRLNGLKKVLKNADKRTPIEVLVAVDDEGRVISDWREVLKKEE